MSDVEARLVRCFEGVFPALLEAEIRTAHQDGVAAWDSLGSIMLVRVVEEEFGLTLDLLDLGELNSFPALLGHIRSQMALNKKRL